MLRFLESMQWVLFIFFTAAYAYQIFYLLVGLWGKQRGGVENAELHRYAAIISARNESAVIGRLIRTLKEQDYPSELLDVIVVADNCTDRIFYCNFNGFRTWNCSHCTAHFRKSGNTF